ncbi:MAG: type II toxin-antitoxin system prevent-host-death family antitoxin [Desulfovibrio sp.]|nr:type II toxin-antitoxin system prevent-host-death family antitoxin [Desulfovibrio sp.]
MPEAISYSEARKNLAKYMDETCDAHDPIIITRQKSRPVVLMSLEDYNSITETSYLLRSKNNAKRIFEAINQIESGKCSSHDIVEVE